MVVQILLDTLDKYIIHIPRRTKQDSARFQSAMQSAHNFQVIIDGILKYYGWKQLTVGNCNSREKSCIEGRTTVESEDLIEMTFY